MKRILKGLFLSIVVFPFLFLVALSLGRNWRYPAVLPTQWSVGNWQALLHDQSDLATSVFLSLTLSISLAAVVTVVSFLTCRAVVRSRHKQRLLVLSYFPYVFAPVVLAACLQFFFLVTDLAGTVGGVWIAQLFITYPFGILFFTSFWDERLFSLQYLAETLGAKPAQVFWKVLLPLAKGPLLVCFFQLFLISWFEYGLTTLLGVGKVQTLTVKVFQYINEANVYFAALASLLLVLPPALLILINRKAIFTTAQFEIH